MKDDGQNEALVYSRVSTKSQEDRTSLKTQTQACVKHAQSLGYKIGRVTEETHSGAVLWDRPKLRADREAIVSGSYMLCH